MATAEKGPQLLLRTLEKPDKQGMPKYPGPLLLGHVTFKTVQAGSILGLALTPILALRSKTPRPFLTALTAPVAWGTFLGIPVGIAMIVARSYTMDAEAVDDKAYRLVHNKGQVEVDRLAGYGGFVGALVGNFMLPGKYIFTRMWRGGAMGVAVGVGSYVVLKMPETEDLRKAVTEAVDKMK